MVRATNKKFTVEVPAGEPITPELVTMVQGYRKAKPKTEAAKKFVTEKLAHAAATDGQQALDADRERTTAADEKPTSLLAKVKKSMSKKVAAPAEKAPEPVVSPEVKPAKKAAEKASGVAPAVEKASRTVYAGRVLEKHGSRPSRRDDCRAQRDVWGQRQGEQVGPPDGTSDCPWLHRLALPEIVFGNISPVHLGRVFSCD